MKKKITIKELITVLYQFLCHITNKNGKGFLYNIVFE